MVAAVAAAVAGLQTLDVAAGMRTEEGATHLPAVEAASAGLWAVEAAAAGLGAMVTAAAGLGAMLSAVAGLGAMEVAAVNQTRMQMTRRKMMKSAAMTTVIREVAVYVGRAVQRACSWPTWEAS